MVTLSGITPSGRLTLGNYLGALQRFATVDEPDDAYFFVADLHALTTPHDAARSARLARESVLLFLAAGLPPGTVFLQSQVPAHAQLAYLLECTATVGELSRMIQFKEKSRRSGDRSVRASLFTYPCLMAADILLYGATRVPVGGDQDQHVELARDLAIRFNRTYGETFVVPELGRAEVAARVCDLQDPTAKMSKSAPEDAPGVIRMLDAPEAIRRKVARAVTDSEGIVRYDPAGKPGVSNLLEILSACTGSPPVVLAKDYTRYGELKSAVADAVIAVLEPVRGRCIELESAPGVVREALDAGRRRAEAVAVPTLERATRAIGLASVEPVC
ncbi:tryptophan--tRNA ligase [Segeticoccus rhizosphaerae]|jgi:tryptophanyl-tRNA synthetase|uniref:tryptophan--tRNA ligase n=1 Tax=Segeticoccus rhizosphaerae TaxID=1104777 RepID=UPI0010C07B8D|nr:MULTISPECIES: tryptophan--tRNA ligase [Intrasporangiaceae]